MATDKSTSTNRLAFVFISAHPRYPWLKIFCFPAISLVLLGLEDSTARCDFSNFQFGSPIVAQSFGLLEMSKKDLFPAMLRKRSHCCASVLKEK